MRSFLAVPAALALAWAATAEAQATPPAETEPAKPAGQEPGATEAPKTPMAAAPAPAAQPAPKSLPVTAKWQAGLYGFAEFDAIGDTEQSLADLAGNGTIARQETYAGNHRRVQFSIRNSRLGFRLQTPELGSGVRATGQIEVDFFGNSGPGAGQASGGVSESGYFASAGLRVRHAFVRVETPYVDVLAGQFWQLFGWQTYFHPNTVEIQGVPGEIFSRTPQLRLSHTFARADPLAVELAVAASRPAQRDSGYPDGQAGVRVLLNAWKGVHTMGSTGTAVDAAAIGFSGIGRRFELQRTATDPHTSTWVNGWGWSLDGLVPVVPGTLQDRRNALTLNGSLVMGVGIADLYTGLAGGLNASGTNTATFLGTSPTVDPGLVWVDAARNTHGVQTRSYLVGAQYYLPVGKGDVWVSANYSRVDFFNMALAAASTGRTSAQVFKKSEWADANLFWDAMDAVRFGLEYARFQQTYLDGQKVFDNRWQLSAWYLF